MKFVKPIVAAAALAAGAGPAVAQDGPSLLDYFTGERLARAVVQGGVSALRSFADITYEGVSADFVTGRISLTGVEVWPAPAWPGGADCRVQIGRLTLQSAGVETIDRVRLKIQGSQLDAAPACLPPAQRGMLGMVGLQSVSVPRLTVDLDYNVGQADARVRAFARVDDAASLSLLADFDYLAISTDFETEEPTAVAYLSNASLTIENNGGWAVAQSMLPPPFADPAQAPVAIASFAPMLEGLQLSSDAATAAELTAAKEGLLTSVTETWPQFLTDPDTLTVQTAIPRGEAILLDPEIMENDPAALFALLAPRMALTTSETRDTLPVALLEAAMAGEDLSADDRLRVGTALVTGQGAPRNLAMGAQILEALALDGSADAALVLAQALAPRQPVDAYTWALVAGSGGAAGNVALLDRLEADLPFETVLEIQSDVGSAAETDPAAFDRIASIRATAAAFYSGENLPRSYPEAAFWASLAAAAGDPEGADILQDIDARARLSGSAAAALWDQLSQDIAERAMQVWIAEDLPSRLTAN